MSTNPVKCHVCNGTGILWEPIYGPSLSFPCQNEIDQLRTDCDRLHRILTRILSKEGIHTPAVNISVTMNEVNGTKTTEELIEFLWEEMEKGKVKTEPAEPFKNRAGDTCGLCDGTHEHEHPQSKCTICGVIGLAENMTTHHHLDPHEFLEKEAGVKL